MDGRTDGMACAFPTSDSDGNIGQGIQHDPRTVGVGVLESSRWDRTSHMKH